MTLPTYNRTRHYLKWAISWMSISEIHPVIKSAQILRTFRIFPPSRMRDFQAMNVGFKWMFVGHCSRTPWVISTSIYIGMFAHFWAKFEKKNSRDEKMSREVAIPDVRHLRKRKRRDLVQNDTNGKMWISVDGNVIETICGRICKTVEFYIKVAFGFLMICFFILILKY